MNTKAYEANVRYFRGANTYIGPVGGQMIHIEIATLADWREAERVVRGCSPRSLKYAAKLRAMIDRGAALGIVADDAKLWPEIQSAETAVRS
jgi:hypothetical protein